MRRSEAVVLRALLTAAIFLCVNAATGIFSLAAASLPKSEPQPPGEGGVKSDSDLENEMAAALRTKDAARVFELIQAGFSLKGRGAMARDVMDLGAISNHAGLIRAAAAAGAPLDPDQPLSAPLHYAAARGNEAAVRALLDLGANPNAREMAGETALALAAEHGHRAVVEMLLAAGAEPNLKSRSSESPLLAAARRGFDDIVQILRAAGARDERLDAALLATAARRGDLDRVVTLLAAGTPPDALDGDRWPLQAAAGQGHLDVAAKLLEAGADVNRVVAASWTPLTLAAREGQSAMVEFLLSRGANVNATAYGELTALSLAAGHGAAEIVKILIAAGATVKPGDRTTGDAVISACAGGHAEALRALLRAGARPDEDDLYAAAVQGGDAETVEVVL